MTPTEALAPARLGRHPLQPATRWLPVAALCMALGAAAFAAPGARLWFLVAATVLGIFWLGSRALRPTLLVDEEGYVVQAGGRVRLRVAYTEVRAVRASDAERALYLDTGDPERNLLLPPPGYGFRFADQDALYARLVQRLADRLVRVERLAPADPPVAPAVLPAGDDAKAGPPPRV